MIVGRFDNFWSGSPVLYIYPEALSGLWALWAWVQATVAHARPTTAVASAANLMIEVAVMVLVTLRCAISRPESTEPRRVHLLLQKVAVVGVVDVCVILQSVDQVLRVL